jgi:hypothetical protein
LFEATIVYTKLEPEVPVAEGALEMTGAGGLIVSVSDAVPDPPVLVAVSAMSAVPGVVGVPEITPVVELMLKPAGNPDAA